MGVEDIVTDWYIVAALISFIGTLIFAAEEFGNGLIQLCHHCTCCNHLSLRCSLICWNMLPCWMKQVVNCLKRICKWLRNSYKKAPESVQFSFIYNLLLFAALVCASRSFAFDKSKYYETFDGISGTTVNVYGAGRVSVDKGITTKTIKIMDGTDVAVPEQENLISFITKDSVKIPQRQGNCSESRDIKEAHCSTDKDCTAGITYRKGNGITTGKCVNGTCEVTGWCPINYEKGQNGVTTETLENLGEYTLHVQSRVTFHVNNKTHNFTNFETEERNYKNGVNKNYCLYDKSNHKHCPYFSVQKSVEDNKGTFPNSSSMSITINFDCDAHGLNHDPKCTLSNEIVPINDFQYQTTNYRYTYAIYNDTDDSLRSLCRAEGFLFYIKVVAKLHVFSSKQLLLSSASAFVVIKSLKPISLVTTVMWFLVVLIFQKIKLCCKKKYQQTSRRRSHSIKSTEITAEADDGEVSSVRQARPGRARSKYGSI